MTTKLATTLIALQSGEREIQFPDLPTSQITKVYFATPKSVFFTQKVYFTSKSQKDAHYPTFKHKNKYNWYTR